MVVSLLVKLGYPEQWVDTFIMTGQPRPLHKHIVQLCLALEDFLRCTGYVRVHGCHGIDIGHVDVKLRIALGVCVVGESVAGEETGTIHCRRDRVIRKE